jgi:hypothetical protein
MEVWLVRVDLQDTACHADHLTPPQDPQAAHQHLQSHHPSCRPQNVPIHLADVAQQRVGPK